MRPAREILVGIEAHLSEPGTVTRRRDRRTTPHQGVNGNNIFKGTSDLILHPPVVWFHILGKHQQQIVPSYCTIAEYAVVHWTKLISYICHFLQIDCTLQKDNVQCHIRYETSHLLAAQQVNILLNSVLLVI